MSKIPLPERGQPLDVAYMYTMAQAINDLSEEGSAFTQGNNFVIEDREGNLNSSRVYASQMVGGYVKVTSLTPTNERNEFIQTFTFGKKFAYPPIVTATMVNNFKTVAGTDVSLVLQDITSTSCDIRVKFGTSGVTSIGVNIIAIGMPD
jgi:hypothetical protein